MGTKHYEFKTKKGYDFYLATSTLQKAIRRGDSRIAGFFGLELYESGFQDYVWLRLLTISAEDCWGIITKEILALQQAWKIAIEKKKRGRVFIAKAIILLSMARKCRDADHLTNLIYDRDDLDHSAIEAYFEEARKEPIPDYAYDVHSRQGKARGKTKHDFIRDEFAALKPREKGLFDL